MKSPRVPEERENSKGAHASGAGGGRQRDNEAAVGNGDERQQHDKARRHFLGFLQAESLKGR